MVSIYIGYMEALLEEDSPVPVVSGVKISLVERTGEVAASSLDFAWERHEENECNLAPFDVNDVNIVAN